MVQKLRRHLLASDATNYTYTPNDGYHRNHLKVEKPLIVATLTKNASYRSYGTFAYPLREHIRNINMRRYITSARGHELSGRVRAHALKYNLTEMHVLGEQTGMKLSCIYQTTKVRGISIEPGCYIEVYIIYIYIYSKD